jgi:2-polyprenyl-3-methyl-5-hydroxy-6-metoxy-1,4-benzoquinol methylase
MVRTDWYRDFFHGMALEFWSDVVPEEHTLNEVEMIVQQLDLRPGDRVLDIPCGNGRHALQLAEDGYMVTAVDISPQFVEVAKAQAKTRKVNVEFVCTDMAEYAADEQFKGVFCLGNSFGYLEYERLQQFLRNVSGSLLAGGSFLIDTTIAAECLLPSFQERDWYDTANMKMLLENSYDPLAGAMETHYTFVRDGQVETRSSLHRVYTAAEIRRMLENAGLTVCHLIGSTYGDTFTLGDAQMYIVATKL